MVCFLYLFFFFFGTLLYDMRNKFFYEQKNDQNYMEPPKQYSGSLSSYLPSKKLVFTVFGILVVVIIIMLRSQIIGLFKKIETKVFPPNDIPAPVIDTNKRNVSFVINKDTDGDGIPDWQEALIGTDSEVFTTIEEVPIEMRSIINDTIGILTTSDQLALAIYERARTNPIGRNYQENLQAATAKEILDLADTIDRQMTTYAEQDVVVIFDEEGVNINKELSDYEEKIKKIIERINIQDIYNRYPNFFNNTDTSADRILFQNLTREIYTIPVPFDYIDQHLALMNALAKIHDTFLQKNNLPAEDQDMMNMILFLVLQKNINVVEKKISEFTILFNL